MHGPANPKCEILFGIAVTCLNLLYILREPEAMLKAFYISRFYFVDIIRVTYVQNFVDRN